MLHYLTIETNISVDLETELEINILSVKSQNFFITKSVTT
jgi:hypothetical protein